jgi:hypothetical protein
MKQEVKRKRAALLERTRAKQIPKRCWGVRDKLCKDTKFWGFLCNGTKQLMWLNERPKWLKYVVQEGWGIYIYIYIYILNPIVDSFLVFSKFPAFQEVWRFILHKNVLCQINPVECHKLRARKVMCLSLEVLIKTTNTNVKRCST